MKHLYPFPELLQNGQDWRVRRGRGAADLEDRVLYVPTDSSAEARFIRTHELLHAEFTRGKLGERALELGVGSDCLNAVEDARINRIFLESLSDVEAVEAGGLSEPEVKELAERIASLGSVRIVTLALLASFSCSKLYGVLAETLEVGSRALYRRALPLARHAERELFHVARPSQRWGEVVAGRLERLLREAGFPGVEEREALALLCALFGGEGAELPGGLRGLPGRGRLGGPPRPMHDWGAMSVEWLVRRRAGDGRAAGRLRPAREGTGVRFLHRHIIDRSIFGVRRRERGGTVLLDTSGSMSLTTAQVESLVRAAPAATVAAYAGKEDHGYLWILAQGGGVADLDAWEGLRCTGNVVDGPALQWLQGQARPRVWITDGGVTGRSDHSAVNLRQECESLVRSGDIARARSIREAVRLLRRGLPR